MDISEPVRVQDVDGAEAILPGAARSTAGHEGQVTLQLDDGHSIVVPGTMLQEQEDGSFYLPLSIRELREAAGLPKGAATGDDRVTTVMPVIEERLDVQKRVHSTRVRVRKEVHTRDEVIDEPVFQEDVEIERVPVGRPVDGPVPVRYEGETMIVPLLEEVLVVEKRLVLREELRITRRRTEGRAVRRETLRTEEPVIERLPGEQNDEPAGFST